MKTRWDIGDNLRLTRNVRDDGTFPGAARGQLLVPRGSVGTVIDIGTFLMDQIIYSLHFLELGRIVGCREEELIGLDEEWISSRFETREHVFSRLALAIGGEVRVVSGARGEILKVLRNGRDDVAYHVHFDCYPGHPLIVREGALAPADPAWSALQKESLHV